MTHASTGSASDPLTTAGDPSSEATAADSGAEWDERYASSAQIWSGSPNEALVGEVDTLQPGRALDVGCGEGADAHWLAGRGWEVTALDVSTLALQRARSAADTVGVRVEWMRAGLLDAPLAHREFGLVSALYPALRRTPTRDAERALVAAVAVEGHLLVVHHFLDAHHIDEARANGFDPADYVSPADVASVLDERWVVECHESRPRQVNGGAGARHTHDMVLHARRIS
jgi:SAM-dependent methyltransferase